MRCQSPRTFRLLILLAVALAVLVHPDRIHNTESVKTRATGVSDRAVALMLAGVVARQSFALRLAHPVGVTQCSMARSENGFHVGTDLADQRPHPPGYIFTSPESPRCACSRVIAMPRS